MTNLNVLFLSTRERFAVRTNTLITRSHWSILWSIGVLVCLSGHNSASAQWEEGGNEYAFDGFLEAYEDALVSAVEVGRVEEVGVKVGDSVEAGQEVARLEDAPQVLAVQIARQQAEMQGDLKAAQAEVVIGTRRVEQLRTLAQQGNARPDELQRAEADLLIAEARLLTAREERELKQLELKRQELLLQRRRIQTPISGVIAEVRCRRGESLSPGDTSVVRVVAKDKLVAIFNLPAPTAIGLRVGQTIAVRPMSIPRIVDGIVHSIAPAIDSESGTVAVRVLINNEDQALYPGDRCVLPSLSSNDQQARRATNRKVN